MDNVLLELMKRNISDLVHDVLLDNALLELMKRNISDLVHDVLKDEPGLIIINKYLVYINKCDCMCLLVYVEALDCPETDAECMSVYFGWISRMARCPVSFARACVAASLAC